MKLLKKSASILLATTMLTAPIFSASALEVASNTASALPSSYSSVEKGYVTPVRHQGDTCLCTAYGTIAACESSLIINNGYDTSTDFSELHLYFFNEFTQSDKMEIFDSIQYNGNYFYTGSHVENIVITLANIGLVEESANHGQFSTDKIHFPHPNNFSVYNKESSYAFSKLRLANAYKFDATEIESIKEHIIKYGAGALEHNANSEYYNEETSTSYCYSENVGANHAIAVVGWDDNYPKENCTVNNHTPEENGAWLIKNSYGTESDINGYKWISYEDKSIINHPVIFYELDSIDTYSNTYQYDDLSTYITFSPENPWDSDDNSENYDDYFIGSAHMANVFTSQNDNEILEAVSFYTSSKSLDYTVEIYTGITDDTDPTSGTLKSLVSGEDLLMGYHTIKLPKSVTLNKDEKFSVVVTLKDSTNPTNKIEVDIDSSSMGSLPPIQRKKSDYGESFFSKDGGKWVDLKTQLDGNMRIKAFTNSDNSPVAVEDFYNYAEGKNRHEIMTELKATLEKCSLALSDSEYKVDSAFLDMYSNYLYTQQAYDNPDKFLALEFYKLNSSLIENFDKLTPLSFEDKIKYYDTTPEWEELLYTYDTILEEVKICIPANEYMREYSNKAEKAYDKYLNFAVDNGAYDSYLQNYGDIDNNSILDVVDVTTLQLLLAKSIDYNFHSYYNADVNGDGEISVVDVTTIQMYLAKITDYMPIYDKQFDSEEIDKNIDFESATAKLKTAKKNAEEALYHILPDNDGYVVLPRQIEDAQVVLENAQDYHPNVIDFKARCLNYKAELALSNA